MKKVIKYVTVLVKRVMIILALINILSWSMYGVYNLGKASVKPQVVEADVVTTQIVESTTTPPVLLRIEKCESGGSQYDKSGQVLIHMNSNGTYDTGIFAINSIWNSLATKMGLDLTKEQDNISFAKWLYANKGTGDWSASAKCWQK